MARNFLFIVAPGFIVSFAGVLARAYMNLYPDGRPQWSGQSGRKAKRWHVWLMKEYGAPPWPVAVAVTCIPVESTIMAGAILSNRHPWLDNIPTQLLDTERHLDPSQLEALGSQTECDSGGREWQGRSAPRSRDPGGPHRRKKSSSTTDVPARPTEFGSQNANDLSTQGGAVNLGRLPNFIPVNPKVRMDQDVPERDYLRPRNLWMSALHIIGYSRRGLSDDGQLLHHGAPDQLRLPEAF